MDASGGSNFLEAPIAEVAIESIRRVEPTKINVREAVAVDIARCNAGSIEKNLVRKMELLGKMVGKENARLRRSE